MKAVFISDTHQLHDRITIPDGDVLVHSGDFTNRGTDGALKDFVTWFASQPHEYKVFIAGNHEMGLDKGATRQHKQEIIKSFTSQNDKLFYLENSEVVINGIKFYGSPITPWFFDWAWNVQRGRAIALAWEMIPEDTNVLITHGPPYGMLDLVQESFGRDAHQGCQDLMNRVKELKQLKVHAFGHLHLEGGKSIQSDGVTFINGAICDDAYHPTRQPVVVEI